METRIDNLFLLNSSIFEEHLKNYDLRLIPGLRAEDDFENWTLSKELRRDMFPFYMTGFDRSNHPIWVFDYGKNNYFKYANGGPRLQKLFDKYMRYICYNALKSHALRSTKEKPIFQHVLIIDFQGIQPHVLANPEVLKLHIRWIRDYLRFSQRFIYKMIVLNVNPVSEYIVSISRFFVRLNFERLVIYGTNKAWWANKLLEIIPPESIPEKYGGNKGFKPLYVIG